jgi:hypothetical protein
MPQSLFLCVSKNILVYPQISMKTLVVDDGGMKYNRSGMRWEISS